jgi:nucleotide-binding universal stress UspA family protein
MPMFKTILVAASGNNGDAAAFAAALAVARPFGAHLEALHVKLDAVGVAVTMATDAGAGAVTAGLVEQLEKDAAERERAARANFTRFCSDAGLAAATAPPSGGTAAPSAEFHVETGEEPRWIAAYGTAADLIVARRGDGEDLVARATLEAALLETGRPVLIPGAAPLPERFERIAVAWKSTPQAARSVALALPFLARTKEILVVTVDEEPEARHDSERLVRNLARHGLSAKAERLAPGPDGAAASLLATITGRADLLVMGGYGHSRVREWVFGGFTQHVLAGAPLPVLMAH